MTPITVLMTDDGQLHTILKLIMQYHNKLLHCCTDNTGWTAAKRVYGEDMRHILCHWHVDR